MNTTRNNAVDGKSSEKFYPKKKTLRPFVDEACNLSVAYIVLQMDKKEYCIVQEDSQMRKSVAGKKCCPPLLP